MITARASGRSFSPDSVTEIESGAFRYCINLETIVIPDSLTEIDKNAFEGCAKIRIARKGEKGVKKYS